jgi:hypothetical protein
VTDVETVDDTPGMSGWDYAAWGLTIGGGALIVAGLATDVSGGGLVDEYEDAASSGDASSYDSLRDDIESRQLTVYSLYGLGGAAAIAGVAMLVLAPGDGAMAVVPTLLGPSTAGVAVGGSF